MNLEEIQYLLAEHENRISFLENSLPGSAMTPMEKAQEVKEIPEKPWGKNQWDRVNQLEARFLNLLGKFLDLEKQLKKEGFLRR